MQTSLLDTISDLAQGLSKEIKNDGLITLLADAAQKFVEEIEELHEGDLLKLSDAEREARQKEMEKYPLQATVFKNGKPVGFTSDPKPYKLEGACSDGLPLGGCLVHGDDPGCKNPVTYCCGPGEACSSSTCTGTPMVDIRTPRFTPEEEKVILKEMHEELPELDSLEAEFPFGMDPKQNASGTTGTTVFPSVGLYEMLYKLTEDQKDGLIRSLGGGRWVKIEALKKAIDDEVRQSDLRYSYTSCKPYEP